MRCLSRLVVLLAFALLSTAIHTSAQAGESVTYSVTGKEYEGYYSKAAGTPKGLVLVIHDWDGRSCPKAWCNSAGHGPGSSLPGRSVGGQGRRC